LLGCDHKDVDAPDKPGHDEEQGVPYKKAPAKPGPFVSPNADKNQRE
jgi:hypothetical protein